jgi:hypothetical protein
MVFEGVGARALCEQLKDPERNGGKDMAELVRHVSAFKDWADAGAPCPRDERASSEGMELR